jgi:hypothetical protein
MPIPIDPDLIRDIKQKLKSKLPMENWNPDNYSFTIPWSLTYVSGGAITSLIQGEEPKDYDVYFRTTPEDGVRERLITKYKDQVADVQERYRELLGTDGKMITENCVTMKEVVSFIFRSYGTPDTMKKTFDYLHCTPHYGILEDKLYISPAAYWACSAKLLIVNNEDKIEEWRTNKFLKRGYRIQQN